MKTKKLAVTVTFTFEILEGDELFDYSTNDWEANLQEILNDTLQLEFIPSVADTNVKVTEERSS